MQSRRVRKYVYATRSCRSTARSITCSGSGAQRHQRRTVACTLLVCCHAACQRQHLRKQVNSFDHNLNLQNFPWRQGWATRPTEVKAVTEIEAVTEIKAVKHTSARSHTCSQCGNDSKEWEGSITWLSRPQCSSEVGSASTRRRGGGSAKSRSHCNASCCSDAESAWSMSVAIDDCSTKHLQLSWTPMPVRCRAVLCALQSPVRSDDLNTALQQIPLV